MNKIISFLILSFFLITGCAQTKKNDYVVTIKTNYGDMVAILYDETPKHKENFIKLAKAKFYDSLLFHRVMQDFMIQGGDPDSKKAGSTDPVGRGGRYTIDAEFNHKFFHEKGALSAARQPDNVNPTKASSGSQFYIVHGKPMSEAELTQLEENIRYSKKNQYLRECLTMPKYEAVRKQVMDKQSAQDGEWLTSFFEKSDTLIQLERPGYIPFAFSMAQKEAYMKTGGAPHLDGDYTIFGQVIKGFEVIDKIAAQPTGPGNRPTEDIRMFVSVEEMPKKKITKEYGYVYPESK